MRVKVAWSIVGRLQQPDQKEEVLDRLRTKTQILIETRSLLIIQVDVKELARFDRLGHHVVEIEPGHLFVAYLGIYANHLRMIECGDEAEHCARRWQVNITTWLIRLGFEREPVIVALVDRVFAKKIQRLAVPLQRLARILRRIYFRAFAAAPEDVNTRA